MCKLCPKCKETKDVEFFSKKGKRLNSWCKDCHKIYKDKHYAINKSEYLAKVKKRRQDNRKIIQKKKSLPCYDCRKSYPFYVMDFDHLANKEFDIASAEKRHGIRQILKEIEKCDVVCSNCHRERTWQRKLMALNTKGRVPGLSNQS